MKENRDIEEKMRKKRKKYIKKTSKENDRKKETDSGTLE